MSRGPGYRYPGSWRAAVRRILQRDGGVCYLCGGQAVTADHVVPQAQGGSHEDANLAAICDPCHTAKSEHERLEGIKRRRTRSRRARRTEPHPGALPRG